MIKAVLFDLDDTLLSNEMATFLPAYLQKLGEHMAEFAPPERLVAELMAGTQEMLQNRDPDRTLQQSFADRFYPALEWDEQEMLPYFEDFYTWVFPELSRITSPRPEARQALEAAVEAGYELAIATNPLFPRMAIEERLRWAGVPAERYPYSLISSYESFHFAKPHPEYFVELVGRLGLRLAEAAMVGDDAENDILPARSLGVATFRIDGDSDGEGPGGALQDAIRWFQDPETAGDPSIGKQPAALLPALRGHLAAALGATQELAGEAWAARPEPGEWAAVEILCHLRDVDLEVNQPRIRTILAESEPFLSAADPDKWAAERGYLQSSGPAAREGFLAARKATLELLEPLEPDAWERPARHALLGPTNLAEILSVAAEHDRLHLEQLRATLARIPHAA